MGINVFSQSIIGYLVGNIVGFFRSIFAKERQQPLWISKWYFQYGDWNYFSLVIPLTVAGFLYILRYNRFTETTHLSFITTIIYVFLFFWIKNILNFFNRIFIFKDRIEIRLWFSTQYVIPFTQVQIVLRDTEGKNFAHIIYDSPQYGLSSIGGGKYEPFWRIPPELFLQPELMINKEKLHPNLFLPYKQVEHTLPPYPIVSEKHDIKSDLKNYSPLENLAGALAIVLNPFVATILMIYFFGSRASSIFSILFIDLTSVYFQTIIRYFSKKSTRLVISTYISTYN